MSGRSVIAIETPAGEASDPATALDKVVVVTGGAGGLGRAMCLALACAGARVVALDRDAAALERLQPGAGAELDAVAGDVTDDRALRDVVSRCLDRYGRIDVVVNNAGIGQASLTGGAGDLVRAWDVAPDTLRQFLSVHAVAGFALAATAVPHMLAQGWGRIITVTTSLDTMIRSGRVPYGPAKAASEAIAAVLSADLEGTGVTANVLIPGGAARTGMVSRRAINSGRTLLDPAVMGKPAVWLASPASDGINGRRFTASKWDTSLSDADAAEVASAPIAWRGLPT